MKRYFRLAIILPLLATAALGCAAVGWHLQGKRVGDAVFHALHVLTVGGDYDDSADWPGNGWLAAARWLGLLFFLLTALKAYRLLLARQWSDLAAQFARRDLVLVGDDPAMPALARLLAPHRRVLWIADGAAAAISGAHAVARPWEARFAARYRLHRAKAVVIGLASDDLRALGIARQIAAVDGIGEIALLSDHLARADGIAVTDALRGVRVIARAPLAARSLHEGYPPFAVAQALGQRRIHALLIGCGDVGAAVIADLLLSSLTTFLDPPRITVVDPRAAALAAALEARMPELAASLDLRFVDAAVDASGDLPASTLRALAGDSPLTCAYVCLPGDRASLAAALALDAAARREDWSLGHIFVAQHSDGLDAAERGALGRLVPFGGVADIADALGLLGGAPDAVARVIHAAYRAAAGPGAPAAVAWDALPETLRDANRRAYMHLPAKLASAGVPIDDWIAARRSRRPARLPRLPDLAGDPALGDRLARLEHDRWMAERRLSGWRHGAVRDDARRVHPDLVPFDQLSTRAQGYDVTVVHSLAASLADGG